MKSMRHKMIPALVVVLLAGSAWHLGSAGYLHTKAWVAQQLIARAWARPDGPARPWSWADMHPVARLAVPRLQSTLYVLSDATDRSLAFGPGVWQGSIGTMHESLVIAGHRDTHFAILRNLIAGDEIGLDLHGGAIRRYRVKESRLVDTRDQALRIDPHGGELILVTCFPFDAINPGGPLRFVVLAEPVRSTMLEKVVL